MFFSTVKKDKIKSFFCIQIVQLKKVLDNPSQYDVLDSLKQEVWDYAVSDSTEDELDSLDNNQDKEVVDDTSDSASVDVVREAQ